jgi:hypothetical protein
MRHRRKKINKPEALARRESFVGLPNALASLFFLCVLSDISHEGLIWPRRRSLFVVRPALASIVKYCVVSEDKFLFGVPEKPLGLKELKRIPPIN